MEADNAWRQEVTPEPDTMELVPQMRPLPHSCTTLHSQRSVQQNGFNSNLSKCVLVLQENKLNGTQNY